MKPRLATLAASVLPAIAAAGCGGASQSAQRTTAKPERAAKDLLPFLPSSTKALARIDAARLRRSPYADIVSGWYEALARNDAQITEAQHKALEVFETAWPRLDTVVGGITPPSSEGRGAAEPKITIVIRGRFEPGQVESWLRAVPQTRAMLRTEREEGHKLLRLGPATLAKMDERTWALTRTSQVDSLLERKDRGPRSDTLLAMYRHVTARPHSLAVAAKVVPETQQLLEASKVVDPDQVEDVRSWGLRFDASDGLALETRTTTENVELARQITERVDTLVEKQRDNPFVILLGFDLLLDSTTSRVEEKTASVRVGLSDAQTDQLLFHLDRLARGVLGLIEQGLGGLEDLPDPLEG